MSGYTLHSEAFNDLDEIRAYIAEDNPDAADRVITAPEKTQLRVLAVFHGRRSPRVMAAILRGRE
jgi:plasmid stabilization system protein ParE